MSFVFMLVEKSDGMLKEFPKGSVSIVDNTKVVLYDRVALTIKGLPRGTNCKFTIIIKQSKQHIKCHFLSIHFLLTKFF